MPSDKRVVSLINQLARTQIVELLEAASIQCYDHESTADLREALRVNHGDGTVTADAIWYVWER